MNTHNSFLGMKKSIFLFSVLLLSTFSFLLSSALAQEAVQVSVSPAIIEKTIVPGTSFVEIISVTNKFPTPMTYYPRIVDIRGAAVNGRLEFARPDEEEIPFSVKEWVIPRDKSITLQPGESRGVVLDIRVPKDINPGARLGMVVFSTYTEEPKEGSGFGIGYDTSSILSFRVAGEVEERVDLYEFSTDKVFYGSPNVIFSTRLENKGNIVERPVGVIEIFDMFGKKIATLTVNERGGVVLPQHIREYITEWRGEGLVLGKYKALLGVQYGETGKRTLAGSVTFWVLPMKLTLIVVGSILAFLGIIFGGARWYVRKELRRVTADVVRKKRKTSSLQVFLSIAIMALSGLILVLIGFLLFA